MSRAVIYVEANEITYTKKEGEIFLKPAIKKPPRFLDGVGGDTRT